MIFIYEFKENEGIANPGLMCNFSLKVYFFLQRLYFNNVTERINDMNIIIGGMVLQHG